MRFCAFADEPLAEGVPVAADQLQAALRDALHRQSAGVDEFARSTGPHTQ